MNKTKRAQHTLTALAFFTSILLLPTTMVFANDQVMPVMGSGQQVTQGVEAGEQRININLASFEQLVALPGIGKVKAKAIIEYRKEVGRFNSLGDIQNIKGIGEKLFIKLKGHIKL